MIPDLSCIAANECAAAERIVWSGQPNPWGTMLGGLFVVPLGLAWTAGSGAMLWQVYASGSPVWALLFPGLFVAVGSFMIVSPIAVYRAAARTLYVITDRRLLVVRRGGKAITSIQLSGIHQVERHSRFGRVTLRIPSTLVPDEGGSRVGYTDLIGVRDWEKAYRLLTQATR